MSKGEQMKQALFVLAAVVALSGSGLLRGTVQAQINPKEWNTEGVKNNPAANTVLCQYQNENPTGETHTIHFVVSSSVTGAFVLEHMDAANTGVLRSHLFPITASLP